MNFEQPSNQAEKSPEQLRFEELLKDSHERSFLVNYAFVDEDDPEDIKRAKEQSMGGYLDSGDQEKVAMYKLRETRQDLKSYNLWLSSFEDDPDYYKGMSKMEKIEAKITGARKHRIEKIKDNTAQVKSSLAELGMELPSTAEDLNSATVKEMINNIETYDNWEKLVEAYKAKPEDEWQKFVSELKASWEKRDNRE